MAKEKRNVGDRNLILAEEDILLDFQATLIKSMNELGLNQAEFAKMLGVSKARISQLLSSDANPTIKLVGRCLALLERKWCFEEKSPDAGHVEASNPSYNADSGGAPSVWAAMWQINISREWYSETASPANENFAEQLEAA